MKFEDAKKLIDDYFDNLEPGELVQSARDFGLTVTKVSSEEKAGLFQIEAIPEVEWEHCPICPDQGWYPVNKNQNWEQEQCEFCWTNLKSVFNQRRIKKDG